MHINISYDFVRDGIMMILLGYDNFEENKQHTGTGTGDAFTSNDVPVAVAVTVVLNLCGLQRLRHPLEVKRSNVKHPI